MNRIHACRTNKQSCRLLVLIVPEIALLRPTEQQDRWPTKSAHACSSSFEGQAKAMIWASASRWCLIFPQCAPHRWTSDLPGQPRWTFNIHRGIYIGARAWLPIGARTVGTAGVGIRNSAEAVSPGSEFISRFKLSTRLNNNLCIIGLPYQAAGTFFVKGTKRIKS